MRHRRESATGTGPVRDQSVTLNLYFAGVWSGLPAVSVAKTWNLCLPGSRPLYFAFEVQTSNAPLSSLHSNVEPASLELNLNFAFVFGDFFFGPFSIVVSGACYLSRRRRLRPRTPSRSGRRCCPAARAWRARSRRRCCSCRRRLRAGSRTRGRSSGSAKAGGDCGAGVPAGEERGRRVNAPQRDTVDGVETAAPPAP